MPTGKDDRLRRAILAVLALGMVGSILDLLLLGHVEGIKQWIPLVALVLALGALGWHVFGTGTDSSQAFITAMVLLFCTGLLGIWFHFQGNREFQLETDATQHGWKLFLKVIRAHAPPALAPASLCLLALFGFAARNSGTGDRKGREAR